MCENSSNQQPHNPTTAAGLAAGAGSPFSRSIRFVLSESLASVYFCALSLIYDRHNTPTSNTLQLITLAPQHPNTNGAARAVYLCVMWYVDRF